jgi:hypothetical protein
MLLDDDQDIGVMIAKNPAEDRQMWRWLADILRITDDGTEYVQPSKIVLPIMTAPSHHVPHLQPADFVIATTAVIAGRKAGLDLKSCWRRSCTSTARATSTAQEWCSFCPTTFITTLSARRAVRNAQSG